MSVDLTSLPENLIAPTDDGATAHLQGRQLPCVALPCTDGTDVNLGALKGRWAIFVYPMTGRPGVPLPDGWDAIPGARGCTPQACGFRDRHEALLDRAVNVLGMSTQDTPYQREARERLHLPYHLLSDSARCLQGELDLPTFTVEGAVLYKRLVLIATDSRIEKVFYPVFPPDQSALQVLEWLHSVG